METNETEDLENTSTGIRQPAMHFNIWLIIISNMQNANDGCGVVVGGVHQKIKLKPVIVPLILFTITLRPPVEFFFC